jgi:hypothetical protein
LREFTDPSIQRVPHARVWLQFVSADAAERRAAAVAVGSATRSHRIELGVRFARTRLRHLSKASMTIANATSL